MSLTLSVIIHSVIFQRPPWSQGKGLNKEQERCPTVLELKAKWEKQVMVPAAPHTRGALGPEAWEPPGQFFHGPHGDLWGKVVNYGPHFATNAVNLITST